MNESLKCCTSMVNGHRTIVEEMSLGLDAGLGLRLCDTGKGRSTFWTRRWR